MLVCVCASMSLYVCGLWVDVNQKQIEAEKLTALKCVMCVIDFRQRRRRQHHIPTIHTHTHLHTHTRGQTGNRLTRGKEIMPKDIKFIKIDCKIIQWSRRQQAVNACIQFLPNMCVWVCCCVRVCVCAAIEECEFSCLVGYWTRKFLGNLWQYGRVVRAGRRHLSGRRRHWPRNVCIKIFMGHSIIIWKRERHSAQRRMRYKKSGQWTSEGSRPDWGHK